MIDRKFNINTNEYLPLRDVIYNTLKEAILTGALAPGDWLVEKQLQKSLDVSRTPIREALRMLVLENLVKLVPRKGAQVLGMSEKDIMESMEIRGALEGEATALSCKRMSIENLQQLKNVEISFEKAITEQDLEEVIEIDDAFHKLIFSATENNWLIHIYENLCVQLYRYRMASAHVNTTSMSTIIAHHRNIIRAIENHEEEEGLFIAQGHIKYQTDAILQFIRNK